MAIQVREVAHPDIALLEQHVPRSHPETHHLRWLEHERGDVSYLIAWDGEFPVGHVVVCWNPNDPAASFLPATPTIADLFVKPELRKRGVGSLLLDAAELRAREKGATHIALSVGLENVSARNLYIRRAYYDSGYPQRLVQWKYMDEAGNEGLEGETCNLWVKRL